MPPSHTMTAPITPVERKTYTDEFRRDAAARRLGMNPEGLRKWKCRHAPALDLSTEDRRLREEVRPLTMDRETLKKS